MDPLDGVGAHHGRGDLAQIDTQIDLTLARRLAQRSIQKAQRLDPSGEPVEALAGRQVRHRPRLDPDQGRDHLQIVPDAVLQFLQLGILLADPLLQLLENRRRASGGRHQCDQPERCPALIVVDDAGPGVDHHRAAVVWHIERAEILLSVRDRLADRDGLGGSHRQAGQVLPASPHHRGVQLARQPFELQIGVDHPLGGFEYGHRHGDRDLIQELPELILLQSHGEI